MKLKAASNETAQDVRKRSSRNHIAALTLHRSRSSCKSYSLRMQAICPHFRNAWPQPMGASDSQLLRVYRCADVRHDFQSPADELKQSLLEEARNKDVEPLIPGKPDTRPPYYTDRMKVWFTFTPSMRSGKAPAEKHLAWPPTLPERADPASREARLLGPLNKRREKNIRWRFLQGIQRRIYPPFDSAQLKALERLIKTPATPLPERKELGRPRLQLSRAAEMTVKGDRPKYVNSRFMRRRYQEIVNSGPVLTAHERGGSIRWTASRADAAKEHGTRPPLSKEDQAWLSK